MNPRRLFRSRDRMLAGVAGGMAEYLDIDPTIIRILWVIIGIASAGFALIAYVILALIMPQAPYATAPGAWGAPSAPPAPIGGWDAGTDAGGYAGAYPGGYAAPAAPSYAPARAQTRGIGIGAIIGLVLIVVGVIALADAALPGWVAGAILGPAIILTLGAALLASSLRWNRDEAPQPAVATPGAAAPWDVTDTQPTGPAATLDADAGTRPS